ncbi:MAG: circularly permuted type 2 ATP-grasp protein [Burkholderiaceae bacterium]
MSTDLFANYDRGGFYCELFGGSDKLPQHARKLITRLGRMKLSTLRRRARASEAELFNLGITFTVYSDKDRIDRIMPFDVVPRLLSKKEWEQIESGCVQRVTALNLLIHDIYHDQKILKDGVLPRELVLGNANFRKEMMGFDPPCGTYAHISGVDLVRGGDGVFRVLEDNVRTPSGVSYVVENRHLMRRAFPDLMDGISVRHVSDYGSRLRDALGEVSPARDGEPNIVLMSPGVFNSAYFEHVFLAREMGATLVEGRDLVVEKDRVFMRTTGGLSRVDVIYRRIDDDFLDPECFNPKSMLGVPGLMRAYLAGNVNIANAVGTGVADDKAVYAYMPQVIRYYLDQDAILPNVETHVPRPRDARVHAREPRVAGGQAGGRVGRLWRGRGPAGQPHGASGAARPAQGQAREFHQPAAHRVVGVPDAVSVGRRAAPCRSAPVHPDRARQLGAARRSDAGGVAQGVFRRELVARRRNQGYLGHWIACFHVSPKTATGSRATWSERRISRASWT